MRIMLVVEGGQSGIGQLHQLGQTEDLQVDVTVPADVMARLAECTYDAVIFHAAERGLTQAFANHAMLLEIMHVLED